MGTLTRPQMEAIIARGESVLFRGRIINRVVDLPSAADLAAGDTAATTALANDLDAQIARLTAERARLVSPAPAGSNEPKPETKKEREAREKAEAEAAAAAAAGQQATT
jgi:hypothetical protein